MGNTPSQHNDLRVILVGPTGLDPGLRADPAMELIRARTAMDAIGELADPIDPAQPSRAVVIVDPRVEPTADGPDQSTSDLAEFLAGLRRVDPDVRVLRLARNGDTLPSGYDGQVGPTTDAAMLRCFLAESARPAPVNDTARVPPADTPAPSLAPPPAETIEPKPVLQVPTAKASFRSGSELELLRMLHTGQPVLAAALRALRAQPGFENVVYAEDSACATDSAAHSAAPVLSGGAVVGSLCSTTLAPASLAPAAEWLGAWLELEHQQQHLRELAFRDPLTGAWNRRFFDDFLPTAIAEARQHRRALTLMVFDIDDFKRFNDQHGHAAGDEILAECVRLLDTAVRPTDKVCRIGGDEFAVIFYEPQGPRQSDSHHPTSVFDIAERFRSLVREARFHKLADDAPGHLTISGGLATFPWDGDSAESLLERADQLALEGKRQGKNVIALGPGCRRLGEG
ncbi:MAG: GGDEF domain-containing protein [Planctomycetota bacterium]|nr:GGDEF domain-containing protein [Planctomycetota bacterium]